ncbi:TPA: hypothetical protein DHW51_21355 [Candidatus Poribacteria bacterium]|nr:hypothetical protein [Candidatus Poribacteria bacterium]
MSVSRVNDAMERVVGEIQRDVLSQEMRVDQPDKKQAVQQQELRSSVSKSNGLPDLESVGKVEAPNHTELLQKVRGVIPKLNSVMHSLNLKLQFEEFAESGRFFVRAIDVVEQKEVTRVPQEEFLRQAEVTKQFVNGLFHDSIR